MIFMVIKEREERRGHQGQGWNEEMQGGEEGVESWKSKSNPGKLFGLCPWAQHFELLKRASRNI